MIVGTAGHIDHGKTSLVQSLTGVNADRLAEEKRRGITIDLGYAYLPCGDNAVLGFVDVPGHERLIHNMLAGATGIDHALLVVAADDGVMPQTREHLGVLSLLGIAEGTVVITKADRVSAPALAQLEQALRDWLSGSFLEGAPIHAVSNASGAGIEALRAHLLARAAERLPGSGGARRRGGLAIGVDEEGFRLSVDRVFTLPGAGIVVTGTVFSGAVGIGERLKLVPRDLDVRVRGIQVGNRASERACRGQRCALNLSGDGLERSDIRRGDWIAEEWLPSRSQRMDARVEVLAQSAQPLRAWMPAHLHVGAADVLCRLLPLSDEQFGPGAQGWLQIVTEVPIHVCAGDRFVLRDQSARETMGGGVIADVVAPERHRRTANRFARLSACSSGDLEQRLLRTLGSGEGYLLSREVAGQWNVREAVLLAVAARCPSCCVLPGASADEGLRIWDGGRLEQSLGEVTAALARFHETFPEETGCERDRLRRMALPECDRGVFNGLVDLLIGRSAIATQGRWLRLPSHEVRLSEEEQRFRDRVLPMLEAQPRDPPWVRDIARELGVGEANERLYMGRLARGGLIHQIVRDWYFAESALEALQAVARELHVREGRVTAARFRDETGLSRKRAIQVLEYFDRVGIMRRVRDAHLIRPGLV